MSNEQMNSLVELGRNGHYPLFHPTWIEETCKEKNKRSTKGDQKKAKEIMDKLSKHKNLDRKRTLIMSLTETDRKLFIKEIFNMVEQSILEEKPILQ